MKTTVDIPDEVADEVRRHAVRDGRELVAEIIQLVKLGILASEFSLAELTQVLRHYRELRNALVHGVPTPRRAFFLEKDPSTGLPIIHSPPDAPIHSMSVDQILALSQAVLEEEDLERAGLSVRH